MCILLNNTFLLYLFTEPLLQCCYKSKEIGVMTYDQYWKCLTVYRKQNVPVLKVNIHSLFYFIE